MRPETQPDDFAAILLIPKRDGSLPLIVGGQAVNLWAERYQGCEPELKNYLPFTSKDLDLIGTMDDVLLFAQKTGARSELERSDVFELSAGTLLLPLHDGMELKIEILKRIEGVATAVIETTAVILDRPSHEVAKVRVIHPVCLLEAKTANTLTLVQDRLGFERQDEKHMRMATLCVHAHLMEELQKVTDGTLSEREYLNLLEWVIQFHQSGNAQKAASRYSIHWEALYPVPELFATQRPKFRAFLQQRLLRVIGTMERGESLEQMTLRTGPPKPLKIETKDLPL